MEHISDNTVTGRLYRFGGRAAMALACAALFLLGGFCFFKTVYMPLDSELAEFRFNGPAFYLCLIAFAALLLLLRRPLSRVKTAYVFWPLFAAEAAFGLVLVFCASTILREDASYIYACASTIRNGSYFSLMPGGYLFLYPHQLGFVTYERLLMLVSSDTRFLFGVNLALVLGIELLLRRSAALLAGERRALLNYAVILSFLFFPQIFFILFLYGLIPGFFFMCLALFFLVKYLKTERLVWLIPSFLSMALACVLRNNFLIAAVVMLLALLLEALRRRRWALVPLAFVPLVLAILAGRGLSVWYSAQSGQDANDGIPKLLWVTMGLQDDEDSERLGGWYNEYSVDLYQDSGYDGELAAVQARGDLAERLSYFASHPFYAVRFFFRKCVSTWCEPTFQSVWSGPLEAYGQNGGAGFLQSIYGEGVGYRILNVFGGVMLLLIYGLSGVYALRVALGKTPLRTEALFPYIFFLGGFLFHLFWETKSQYVYPYVFLLIPTAAQTLEALGRWLEARLPRRNGGKHPK